MPPARRNSRKSSTASSGRSRRQSNGQGRRSSAVGAEPKDATEDEESSDSDDSASSQDSYSSLETHTQKRREERNQNERAKMEANERRRKEKEQRPSSMFTTGSATSGDSEESGDEDTDFNFEDHQRKNRERINAKQWENKRRGDERRERERRERADDQEDGERGSNQLSGSDTNDSDSEMTGTGTPTVSRQRSEKPPPYEFDTIKMSQEAKAHIPPELFSKTVKPPPPKRKSSSRRTSTTAEAPVATEPRASNKENQPSRKSAAGQMNAEHVQEEAVLPEAGISSGPSKKRRSSHTFHVSSSSKRARIPEFEESDGEMETEPETVPASAESEEESPSAPNNQPTPPAGPTPEVSSPDKSHRALEQQQRNALVDEELLLVRNFSPQENDEEFFTSTPAFKPGTVRGHGHLNLSPVVGKTVSASNIILTQKKKPKERPLSQRDKVLTRNAHLANAKEAAPAATQVVAGDEVETPESEPAAAVPLSPLPKGRKDGETDTRSSRRKPETALPSTSAGTEAVVSGKPETEEVQPAATFTVQPLATGRRDGGTTMRSSQKQPESAAPSSTARINEPVVDGETEPVSAAALPPLPKGRRGGPPVTRSSRRKPKVAQPSTSAVGETETHEEEEPAAVAVQSRPKGRRIDGSTVTRSSRVKRKAPQPSSSAPTEAVAGGKTDALEDDPGAAAVAVLPIPKGKKAGATTKRSRRERKIAQPSSSAAGEVETSEDEHAAEDAPSPLPKGRKRGPTTTKSSRKRPKVTLPTSFSRPPPIREVSEEEDEEDNIDLPMTSSILEATTTRRKEVQTSQSQPVRDQPVAGPSGSQLSVAMSQQSNVSIRSRQSRRRSIFEIARADAGPSRSTAGTSRDGRPRPRREKTPERYVGNDAFGNYHMMKVADVARILQSVRPNHKLSEEQIKQMTLKINHFLEDLFTDLCNNTQHPHGFVSFQQLKQALIDQCLLEEGATTDDLMDKMKESIPKEDWKRSEGILYPHRHSRKEDTDNFY